MQAKTIKRFVILLMMLGLLGGTGLFVQRLQVARLAKEVLTEAKQAESNGKYNEAENLYWQHLEIFPDDVDVQIKYAEAHLKVAKTFTRQAESLGVYNTIVRQDPGHENARRRLMELELDTGNYADARTHLEILLKNKSNRGDGDLWWKMGRCCEAARDDKKAVESYREAINNRVPNRIEVYERLAEVLRGRLGQEKEAGDIIAEMVQSDPKNYKVYLARGKYLLTNKDLSKRKTLLGKANDDFQRALELAPGKAEIYLERAKVAESESGNAAAQKILREGIAASPPSDSLYGALAEMERRANQVDKAIKTLEDGLKKCPEDPQGRLRWMLANVLAQQRDTGKLLLHIEELKKIGFPGGAVTFLNAHYYINKGDYITARQLLVPLQATMKHWPELKAQINVLLAQCHSQLMEPEMEREAYLRAVSANPNDLTAKLGWINGMVNQGNLEGAIKEYRALVNQIPQVRLHLARLLIATNRQRPATERNWSEVEDLLAEAVKAMPLSIEPVVLTADLRMAQGNPAAARRELEKAKAIPAFSKSVDLRVAQAAVAGMDGRFEEALKLLDQAQQELGDRVEFRLQRARLWSHNATQKGPQVVSALNDLAKNVERFSEDERRKLLTGLAAELLRQQDLQGASRLWTQLAEHEPKNLEIRLTLLDLAFQTANEEEIRKNIDQIKEIDGNDEVLGRYCEVRYLIWQAGRATDKNKRIIYRDNARAQLNDLMSRSGNWSVIPLARGQLEEQELGESGLKDEERSAKEESIANQYLQAVHLGQRQPAVVRRTLQLLFKTKRGSDALGLLNSIPAAAQLAGDVGRQAVQFAIQNRDFQQAQEIARKAVDKNPGDFQERLWLVRVLLESGEQARAETALREAVDLSKSDPDRWIALVLFMILTKQPDKAEQAIRDAETNLPKPQVALTLAQGCELIGRAHEMANREDATKKWYGEAQKWYQKAQSDHPGDYSILRRQTEFYLRTKQMAEAESLLADVLKRTAERSNTDAYAWAKRTLALTYASRPGVERMQKALALFEPDGRTVPAGQEGRTLADAEDLRILARVLDAQRTPEQLNRAIQILESLIQKNLANNEDRFLLGSLYEKSGDWTKAKEEYRALNFRTKNARDLESLNRRPAYLFRFAESALRHHPDANDLAEIQDLVDELQQLQPQAIATLAVRVDLYRAQRHPEKAVEIIKEQAGRSNLTPTALATLANLAEKQNQVELARQIYGQLAETPTPRGKLELAKFLGRQHKIKEALDACEKLWLTSREPELLAATCIEVLYADESLDPAHLNRVSSWIEQALAKPAMLNPRSKHLLLVGLGNIRERQGNYPQAEALYENAIKEGDRDGTSRNNLAWLITLKDGKRKGKAALDYINEAIELSGPRADFFDTRGVVYLNTGDLRLAINDLEKAVALDPSAPKYFHLAQAYHEFKDKQKAKENLEKAKNKGLTPNNLHPLEQPAYDKLLNEYAKP